MKTRYAVLTVDTEALPNRAETDHVNRLILGVHGERQAGVREMVSIGAEFGARLIFFMDTCGALAYADELRDVARWLVANGQDVQLHAHPEYLPASFWKKHKLTALPAYLNEYTDDRASFIITKFAKMLTEFTGVAPVAFRAGSFRWNSGTLKALKVNGIRLSFNNSMCAVYNKQCAFSLPTNDPYRWSNGIYEIPVTEHQIFPRIEPAWWARLQFPQSKFYRLRNKILNFMPGSVKRDMELITVLIHSWSFLYRDEDGYEVYRDERWLEEYRKLIRRLTLDYEIITSKELLELLEAGKIKIDHTEDIGVAKRMPCKMKRNNKKYFNEPKTVKK